MAITRGDWDLHQSGSKDAARHREKLKDAFREKLHDIISEESIITQDKGKAIKVPIKALDSYRFVFDPKGQKQTGQGNGDTNKGDILQKEAEQGKGKGDKPGQGEEAGDAEGEIYYEAEIDLDDLIDMMLEDLQLPRLDPKKKADLTVPDTHWDDVRKKGMISNLDKKRSLINNVKRNAAKGSAGVGNFHTDDLRFRTWSDRNRPVTSAVVIAMMDVSGSMTTGKKYLARSFFFWMVNFLRRKYQNVEIVFISHTTTARICTEQEFFYQGESGGTQVSSAYELALKTIQDDFDPNLWNVFSFHFSDGDTFGDVDECAELMNQLADVCNVAGYGEIDLYGRDAYALTTLYNSLTARVKKETFVATKIGSKKDIWPSLRKFLSEEIEA